MPGIGAAAKPNRDIVMLHYQIYNFSLALIPPVPPDHHQIAVWEEYFF